jgi:hypothetical protein
MVMYACVLAGAAAAAAVMTAQSVCGQVCLQEQHKAEQVH